MADKEALDAKMQRVEQLVDALNACPDPLVRSQAQELVATLMDFHAEGFTRNIRNSGSSWRERTRGVECDGKRHDRRQPAVDVRDASG